MIKKSNKIKYSYIPVFIVLIMCFIFSATSGQSVIFCENVDKYGKPTNPADTFDIDTSGSAICILFKAGGPLNTTEVQFEIYYYDDNDSLILNNTLTQNVQKNWLYCWQRLSFRDAGKFKIYAYNASHELLGAGEVVLIIRKE